MYNIGGDVIKDNDVYTVMDNTDLEKLVLSLTVLHPYKETTGHRPVEPGDIVLIPDGAFYKVFNHSDGNLMFNCVFDNERKT
tara:strand:- start:3941 stop:4186 length:246 start_codon:yes stop_codon:yes gene_type:complete